MSGYDENLLKDAPEASRAARQEGYNIDLLAPDRVQSPSADPPARTPSAPPGPSFPPGPGESEYATGTNGPGAKEYGSSSQEEEGGAPRPHTKPVSFWKTTRGRVLIGLIALVVIGAIIGGAVGGATSSKGGSKASNPSSVTSSRSQPYSSAESSPTKTQPAGSTSVVQTAGGGSETSNGNGAQSGTSTAPPTSVSPGGLGIHGMVFNGGAAVAESSRDRRRHPSPARGVAGAGVDD